MADRYRNSRPLDDGLEEDLKARDEALNNNTEGGDPGSKPADGEENTGNWKKRHGDLRRASTKREDELKARIKELEEGQKVNLRFPAEESEFKDWLERHPTATKMIDTLVQKRILEGHGMLEGRMSRVQELEDQIANDKLERDKDKALQKIKKAHPDFLTLVDSDKFQEWIETQADWVKEALWENETDAQSAIDAVDLYKSRNKVRDKQLEERNAGGVSRSSNPAPSGGGDFIYTESGVARMNDAEYERHEDKIKEAIREGKFRYDLTQSA